MNQRDRTRPSGPDHVLYLLLSVVLVTLPYGCTTDETSSQQDYEPWKESAEGKRRQREITADDLSDDVKRGPVSKGEIRELRNSKSYVRKNLPVDKINWTYHLEDAAPIVQAWLGPEYIYAETEDYHLWAIDRDSGNPKWKFILHGRIDFRPTFVHGIPRQKIQLKKKIQTLESRLASLRKEVGENREKIRELTSDLDVARNQHQELVDVDRVYVVVGTTMYVLDREFGTQLDRVSLSFSPSSRPYATRNRVIIPGYYRNYVHFLNTSNFTEQTEERVRMDQPVEVPIQSTGNLFLLGTDKGVLYALDSNQKWQWAKQTDGPISAAPAIWKDQIFLGSDGMQIYALSRFTGENTWTHQLSTPIRKTPWVSSPHLYVRDEKNRFHAFALETGEKRWTRTSGPTSFLFKNGSQILTHNPSRKTTYVLSEESGKTLSTGSYDRFDYIFRNDREPVFLLATRGGTFVSADASKIGIAWEKVGPDPDRKE